MDRHSGPAYTELVLLWHRVFLVGYALGIWRVDQFSSVWTILTGDFSAAWLAGFFAIFIPSGLGVRELVLSSLLTSHFQLVEGVSRAIAVIMRLIMVLAEFATILLTTLLYLIFKEERRSASQIAKNGPEAERFPFRYPKLDYAIASLGGITRKYY